MCIAPTTRMVRSEASWSRNRSQSFRLAIKPAPAGFIFSSTALSVFRRRRVAALDGARRAPCDFAQTGTGGTSYLMRLHWLVRLSLRLCVRGLEPVDGDHDVLDHVATVLVKGRPLPTLRVGIPFRPQGARDVEDLDEQPRGDGNEVQFGVRSIGSRGQCIEGVGENHLDADITRPVYHDVPGAHFVQTDGLAGVYSVGHHMGEQKGCVASESGQRASPGSDPLAGRMVEADAALMVGQVLSRPGITYRPFEVRASR